MIEQRITQEQLEAAEKLSDDMGALKGSITKGDGNLAGFVGEIVVADYLGARQANTYDYDLLTPDGHTIDVKSKRTNFEPQPHYECSVAAYNTKQDADYYLFTRIKLPFQIWLLGYISKKEYYEIGQYKKKGMIDPSNGFKFKANAYNVPISSLYDIKELV